MAEVTFDCDRCGEKVQGHQYADFTAGYYYVGPGSGWQHFAQDGEERICDSCMWSNSMYQQVYGVHE